MVPFPPSESQILQSYLLHPSSLSTIIPYTTFQTLLPAASSRQKTNPELRRLYRDLQFQRDVVVDDVRQRIETECRNGFGLRSRLSRQIRKQQGESGFGKGRKRKRDNRDEDEDDGGVDMDEIRQEDDMTVDDADEVEIKLDTSLHGPLGNTLRTATSQNNANHTIASLLSALSAANMDLSSEIMSLESKIEHLRRDCEERVGALSDLRYGKFAGAASAGGEQTGGGGQIEAAVIASLGELRRAL